MFINETIFAHTARSPLSGVVYVKPCDRTDYTRVLSVCYKRMASRINRDDAIAACRNDHARIAEPIGIGQLIALREWSGVDCTDVSELIWIGYDNPTGEEMYFLNGTKVPFPVLKDWAPKEAQHCMTVAQDCNADTDCVNLKPYMCEITL